MVLATLVSRVPESHKRHDPNKVLKECSLSGLDFNLGLNELEAYQLNNYSIAFLAKDGIGLNPDAWKLAEEREDELKKLLESDAE